ncbi:hypothetical protein VTN96DRAFT_630 [Rasamsonia emersonii]
MFIMILHVLTAWSSTSSDGDFDAGRRSTSSLLFFLILMRENLLFVFLSGTLAVLLSSQPWFLTPTWRIGRSFRGK